MVVPLFPLASYTFSPYAVPTLVTAAAILLLGVVVLLHERRSAVSAAFCVMAATVSVWLFAFSWMYCATDPRVALWWARAGHVGILLIPAAVYHFTVSVLRITQRCRRVVVLAWGLGAAFVALMLGAEAIVIGVHREWWGYYTRYDLLNLPFLLLFFGMMVASLRHYWVAYRKASPGSRYRRRARLFLIAIGIGYVGSVDYLAAYGVALYPFGYLPILGFVVLAARAIRRYRLVDITPAFAASQIVETMNDALIVLDQEGLVKVINQEASRLLGYREDELVGKPSSVALNGALSPSQLEGVLRTGGDIRNRETTYYPKTGGSRILSFSASVMRDPMTDQPVGVVCVARDITDRKQEERRLAAQHAVTRVLADSATLDEAAPKLLQAIGECLGWDVGVLWVVESRANALRCAEVWHQPDVAVPEFEAASRQQTAEPGRELPGRVWASGQPVWIAELSKELPLLRATLAAKEGLHGAIGFPILLGEEVLGVMEFFSRDVQPPDPAIPDMMRAIGRQVGQFLKRKWAEEDLRERTIALQHAVEGISRLDSKGRYLSVNQAYADLAGYAPQVLVGQEWLMTVHPQDRAAVLEAYRQMLTRGKAEVEARGVRQDGSIRHHRLVLISVSDELRQFLGHYCFLKDITEHKQDEQELQRLASFPEQDPNPIIELNCVGAVTYGNPAVHNHFPDLARLGSQHPILRGVPVMVAALHQAGKATTLTREVSIGEWIYEQVITAIPGTQLLRLHMRDITDRKRLESQLLQAQKFEVIGQLAAGIAHEINTPIQYVGNNISFLHQIFGHLDQLLEGYGQLLGAAKQGAISPALVAQVEALSQKLDLAYLRAEVPKAVAQSLEGVERVAKIVRSVRELSHPGSPTAKVPLDLNQTLESAITVVRSEWKHVAEVAADFDPTLPPVPCLEDAIHQALLNILINAAQAITEAVAGTSRQGTITVTTRHDGDWAEISIRDTGRGIPPAIQSKIFEPFFTTKEIGHGTGQGLAIAHASIVRQHGGTIRFETAEGQGTTFMIRLPIHPTPLQEMGESR